MDNLVSRKVIKILCISNQYDKNKINNSVVAVKFVNHNVVQKNNAMSRF